MNQTSPSSRPSDVPSLGDFPLGCISARVNPKERSRTYRVHIAEGPSGKSELHILRITAAEKDHLPTSEDLEVFVALVAQSRKQGMHKVFRSTRYQLAQILGWETGQRYKRLAASLRRWQQTLFNYEVELTDSEGGSTSSRTPTFRLLLPPDGTSDEIEFTWHDLVHRALQLPPWSSMDLAIALRLKRAISRQLYVLLSDKLLFSARFEVSLAMLGFEHLGLSRKYQMAQLKQIIVPALLDLERSGVVAPKDVKERFVKLEKRGWVVIFEKAAGERPSRTPM
jgi:Replication initiator protein A